MEDQFEAIVGAVSDICEGASDGAWLRWDALDEENPSLNEPALECALSDLRSHHSKADMPIITRGIETPTAIAFLFTPPPLEGCEVGDFELESEPMTVLDGDTADVGVVDDPDEVDDAIASSVMLKVFDWA
jgi:hypothetical protein